MIVSQAVVKYLPSSIWKHLIHTKTSLQNVELKAQVNEYTGIKRAGKFFNAAILIVFHQLESMGKWTIFCKGK